MCINILKALLTDILVSLDLYYSFEVIYLLKNPETKLGGSTRVPACALNNAR
jgi:hypothetical protein